jgi:Flp pilus assembly protein CpaB
MLATRRGAFALALVCGLAATGVLVFALGKYQHSVTQTAKQDTVLVSTAAIPKGTSADAIASQRLYKVVPVLASNVSPGAIGDAGTLSGQIAASNILPGQQLTSADFTAAVGGVTGELTPDERAIAVTLDPTHGLASVLKAGDHVDVYGSFASSPGGKAAPVPIITLLVPNATILQGPGGSASAAAAAAGSAGGTLLLGISVQLSPRVMWAFDNGKVWVELRGVNSSDPAPTITGLPQVLLGNALSTTPTYPIAQATGVKR